MIDVHTPDERIAVQSLEQMLDVTLGLIDAARAA
jgi:di/tripeptidase